MLEIQSQDIVLMSLIRWNLSGKENPKDLVLIAPDEGAFKKTEALLDKFYSSNFNDVSMVRCFKKRDPKTGKILSVECLDKIPNKPVTVVVTDDICDGGGTFIALIENIKHKFCVGSKFYLCVTHGIFSKGVDVLKEAGYDAVFAANDMTKYEQPY
jgi:ribose-phosphate pyrophosphokinase